MNTENNEKQSQNNGLPEWAKALAFIAGFILLFLLAAQFLQMDNDVKDKDEILDIMRNSTPTVSVVDSQGRV